jgi:hypothetical protein
MTKKPTKPTLKKKVSSKKTKNHKEQFKKYLERIEDPKYDGADAS